MPSVLPVPGDSPHSSVRRLLNDDATKSILCAFVLSRLDYCNALLAGSPKQLIEKLHKAQNRAARLFRCSKLDNVIPHLHSLHWLPVISESTTRFLLSVSKFLNQFTCLISYMFAPPPLPISPKLRSSPGDLLFCVPHIRTKSYGQRSFAYQGANIWNQFPHSVRHSQSLTSFKPKLKTHFFQNE